MSAQHGITANTYQRIVMGPGAVYVGAGPTLLGATKGGNVFELNRVIRDIRPDGAPGRIKNYRYIEEVEARLTVRLVEIDESTLVKAIAGGNLAGAVITGGEIATADYTHVEIRAEVKGITTTTENNLVTIELEDCLPENPLTLELPESGEVVVEITWVAHYDPTALTTEPWSITFTPVT